MNWILIITLSYGITITVPAGSYQDCMSTKDKFKKLFIEAEIKAKCEQDLNN